MNSDSKEIKNSRRVPFVPLGEVSEFIGGTSFQEKGFRGMRFSCYTLWTEKQKQNCVIGTTITKSWY